jgi:hypothetical protein
VIGHLPRHRSETLSPMFGAERPCMPAWASASGLPRREPGVTIAKSAYWPKPDHSTDLAGWPCLTQGGLGRLQPGYRLPTRTKLFVP